MKLVWFSFLLFQVISLNGFAQTPSPSSDRGFGISGKLMGDAYVPTVPLPNSKTFEQLSTTAQLQAELHFFEHSSGRVTYQGKIFDGNNSNITGDTNVTHLQSVIREGYYQFSSEGWDVRAGRQIISWGKSDALNPTDFLTAKDYSHFQPDDEDRRLGGTGLWVSHTFAQGRSPVNLVLVWNLVYPQSKLLFPSSSNLPQGVVLYDPQTQPTGLNNSEVAAKVSYSGQTWDASLSFFSGYNHIPQLQEISHGIGPQGVFVNVGQAFTHVTAVGADGSLSLKAWVFRLETAYSMTENGDGSNSLYLPNHFDTVLGTERSLGGDFRVQVQGVWRYFPLLGGTQVSGPDPLSIGVSQQIAKTNALLSQYQMASRTSGTLRVTYSSEKSGLDAEIFLLQNFDGGDYLLRPLVTYGWTDSFKTSVGSQLFGGPSNRPLGAFNSYSSVFSEVKYIF